MPTPAETYNHYLTLFTNTYNDMDFPNQTIKNAYIELKCVIACRDEVIQNALNSLNNKRAGIQIKFQLKYIKKYEKMLKHLDTQIYKHNEKRSKELALGVVAN